ncbi:peptidase inhibitor family I36 protein [Streptomyces sp. SCSIO 30461]|uniref:peptidase inhibitor family I36 protein n=1 Tax=Streptomyces sp. SCSIO 30461 TaxID=3118085 RepID=UPI0030D013F5
MKRNLVGAALIGAALIVGGTGIASAAPAGCTASGAVCLYRDDDYRGGQVTLSGTTTGITHLSSYGFNDQADSYYNNSTKDAAWYTDANYAGRRVCMHSTSGNHSFSFQDSDEASSTRKLSSASSC